MYEIKDTFFSVIQLGCIIDLLGTYFTLSQIYLFIGKLELQKERGKVEREMFYPLVHSLHYHNGHD